MEEQQNKGMGDGYDHNKVDHPIHNQLKKVKQESEKNIIGGSVAHPEITRMITRQHSRSRLGLAGRSISVVSMASVSATFVTFEKSLKLSCRTNNQIKGTSASLISVGWARNAGFPSLRISRSRITCAAKPETVQKVSDIVREQLALSAETELTPDTKFTALGADSLDTVEIVMGLEEEFGINVEEESSDNITTIQEAAELIEKLVEKKGGA
ncbi:Acyl carrier protein 4 [Abeliophyllum distichum]|uniref:Acyl carrier protein n=1 Tax=Abeliophyllum distichum TaxID=126358 RepID=A0ABD1VQ84_9LAMI